FLEWGFFNPCHTITGSLQRNHSHCSPVQATFDGEKDFSFHFSKEGMITTNSHVLTRVKLSPTLTHDDPARLDQFPAKTLYSQTFGLRITSVSGTATCFLMCHKSISFMRKCR